jgi:cytosine/adenosine deaminase-related metal-dependent hydrolase
MGALAQIDAGVTTLVDWCHNITTTEHAERAVDGLIDSGIRAVFAHGTAKPIGLETGTPFTQVPHPRERIEALRKGRLASDDGRVTLAMAILGPDWGSWEVVEHDIRMAREFGLVSSSHTRRREDCVVPDGYARMAKSQLLGPGQMFREMQAALLFVRGKEVRNNASRGNSPLKKIPVGSREALEWATINGAKAFRLDGRIGTLTPGKRADIVMLRASDINMAPVYDPVISIVEIAGAGNVDTVIIDGATLRRRMDELAESGARIMREGNFRLKGAPN